MPRRLFGHQCEVWNVRFCVAAFSWMTEMLALSKGRACELPQGGVGKDSSVLNNYGFHIPCKISTGNRISMTKLFTCNA